MSSKPFVYVNGETVELETSDVDGLLFVPLSTYNCERCGRDLGYTGSESGGGRTPFFVCIANGGCGLYYPIYNASVQPKAVHRVTSDDEPLWKQAGFQNEDLYEAWKKSYDK